MSHSGLAIVGGEYWLPPDWQAVPACEDSLAAYLAGFFPRLGYFASGRDACLAAVETLLAQGHLKPDPVSSGVQSGGDGGASVALPDYCCDALVQALRKGGHSPRLYPVGNDLISRAGETPAIRQDDDASAGRWPSVTIVVNFFGVVDRPLYRSLRERGAVVVSDVTHLVLNSEELAWVRDHSHLVFGSLRKIGPYPDLGFVGSGARGMEIPRLSLEERPDFSALRLAALVARGRARAGEPWKDDDLRMIEAAEQMLENAGTFGHAASEASRKILHTVAAAPLVEGARANVTLLREKLASRDGAGSDLAGKVSPYFPVVFAKKSVRDRVRQCLAAEGYFCPVHWPTPFRTPAHPLSKLILSIPCDARFSPGLMARLAERLLELEGTFSC